MSETSDTPSNGASAIALVEGMEPLAATAATEAVEANMNVPDMWLQLSSIAISLKRIADEMTHRIPAYREEREEDHLSRLEREVSAPTDDGWLPWHGGECPVAPETMVEYQMRDEEPPFDTTAAFGLRWSHEDDGSDIIAYRVVKS